MTAGALLALGTAACWTLANFTIRGASRRFGSYPSLALALLLGTVLLAIFALATSGLPAIPGPRTGVALAGAGIAAVLGYGGLFVAMGEGRVSVSAAIISSWSLVALFIGIAFRGEWLTVEQAIGVGLLIGGNLLLATGEIADVRGGRARPGPLVAAVLSAIGFALLAPLTDIATPELGRVWPQPLVWGVASAVGFPVLAKLGRLRRLPRRPRDLGLLALPAAFEAGGFLCLILALGTEPLAIVGPLAGLSTGMTVVAGIVLLREPLRVRSIAGAFAASAGVVLVQL